MLNADKAKQYGLEEVIVVSSLEDLLDEAKAIAENDDGASIAGLADETKAAYNVVNVLDDIATDAVDNNVAVESLNYALNAVLKSHGSKKLLTSVESLDKADAVKVIHTKSLESAAFIKEQLVATTEDYLGDIRYNINSKLNLTLRAKHSLDQSLHTIESKRKHIEANGVDINYHGIYDFLHRDFRPVTDLGQCLKPDMLVMQNLKKVLDVINSDMQHQLLHINPRSNDALKQFCNGVKYMNFGGKLNSVNGYRLLGNGFLSLLTRRFDVEEEIDTYILDVSYRRTANDGSKNTLGANIKTAALVGLPFIIGGAVVGGVMTGNVGGAVVGGAVGGVIGGAAGWNESNRSMRGTQTNVNVGLNPAIEFIKDASTICDSQKDLMKYLDKVGHDIAIIRGLAKEILRNVDDNLLLVILINTLGQVATDHINSKKGEGEEKLEYTRIKTNKEIAQELLDDYVTSIYYSYVSVLDALVDHSFVCVKNTLEVASRLAK